MTEKRYDLIFQGIWDNIEDYELDWGEIVDLLNENEQLKSDVYYADSLLKRTIDELEYFTRPFKEKDDLDFTVHNLFRSVNLYLDGHKDNITGFMDYVIEENEQLKKEIEIHKEDGLETLNDLQRCKENNRKALVNIEKLTKENEQLKKENEECKLMIATLRNIILEKGDDE